MPKSLMRRVDVVECSVDLQVLATCVRLLHVSFGCGPPLLFIDQERGGMVTWMCHSDRSDESLILSYLIGVF